MTAYLLRRLIWVVLLLAGVSLATFVIFFQIPSNPAELVAGKNATPEMIANIERRLGLDQPWYVQYWRFLHRAIRGDLGFSYITQQEVAPILLAAFPVTLSLAIGAAIIWLAIGIPIGVLSALKPRSLPDRLAMIFALVGISTPVFWLGLVMLKVFADTLGCFPLGDYMEISRGGFFSWMHHLILPWITLAFLYAGWYARMTRANMLETLGEDYVRTARAKGLAEGKVVFKHVLRNSLTPVVTMFGMDLGYLLGGAVLTETVFGLPGIGGLAWRAIQQRDLPMVMGAVVFAAVFIILANLVVDLFYAVLDPRVRYR
ncbi:MAG: ABC transporter permease [candidate division Zixibacteria bacterium SM23_81]|nr:MAG: ABC transporter permease [candidate division Zixibacteria bacterium SM23_81]